MLNYLKIKIKGLTRRISLALLGKQNIKVVREEEVKDLFKSLGIGEKFTNGGLDCFVCKKPVTVSNLQAIVKINGKIELICSDVTCVNKLS